MGPDKKITAPGTAQSSLLGEVVRSHSACARCGTGRVQRPAAITAEFRDGWIFGTAVWGIEHL